MPWDIKRAGDGGDDWLIMDGNRLRGTIHHAEPVFRVEIRWSGRGGDITFSGPTLGACADYHGSWQRRRRHRV